MVKITQGKCIITLSGGGGVGGGEATGGWEGLFRLVPKSQGGFQTKFKF
jgi:hypothetical protein